jgi:NAD(P)-dependent dehydrogenase (short-subunit alcohol dehydrogenase family)
MTIDRSLVDLDGRVAVVTGAAAGIGAATATALAAFGADVALCDLRPEQLATVAAGWNNSADARSRPRPMSETTTGCRSSRRAYATSSDVSTSS